MIDDLGTIESLMEGIRAALPMRAHVGRDVLRTLRRESPQAALSHQCDITEVRYAGDEGGILCVLLISATMHRRRCTTALAGDHSRSLSRICRIIS